MYHTECLILTILFHTPVMSDNVACADFESVTFQKLVYFKNVLPFFTLILFKHQICIILYMYKLKPIGPNSLKRTNFNSGLNLD